MYKLKKLIVSAKDKDTKKEHMHKLKEAIIHGNIKAIQQLVEKNVNVRSEHRQTPLHWAAEVGNLSIVEYLVKKGAKVNAKDSNRQTPLHFAANRGHLAVVEYLIKKNAKVNAKDENGETPLHWATITGHLNIVRYLIGKGSDIKALGNAIHTPLHKAAGCGHLAIVEYLIEKGADVNPDNTQTPLHCAAANGHQDTIVFLVENGAHVNAKDSDGQTALHWAAAHRGQDAIAVLIEKGADVNARNKESKTALHFAVSYIYVSYVSTIQLLLAQGAYHDKDVEIEEDLKLWLNAWKKQTAISKEQIRFGTTILLAGVSISDDALPEQLKSVKADIYTAVKQWLSPLALSSEDLHRYIPLVLRALPHMMHLAEYIYQTKMPAIGAGYKGALKQCFLQDSQTLQKSGSSILQGLKNKELPPELILMILETLRDKEVVKILSHYHELDDYVTDYLWDKSKLYFAKRTQPLPPGGTGDVSILEELWNTKLGLTLKQIPSILNIDEEMVETLSRDNATFHP